MTHFEITLFLAEFLGFNDPEDEFMVSASLRDAVLRATGEAISTPLLTRVTFNKSLSWTLSLYSLRELNREDIPIRLIVQKNGLIYGFLDVPLRKASSIRRGWDVNDIFKSDSHCSLIHSFESRGTPDETLCLRWLLTISLSQPLVIPRINQDYLPREIGINSILKIGPDNKELFRVTFSICQTKNLHLLLPRNIFRRFNCSPFHFTFCAFGERIRSKDFTNLRRPETLPEKTIGFRINTSPSSLLSYMRAMETLRISLTTSGNGKLAKVCIPLGEMMSNYKEKSLKVAESLSIYHIYPFESNKRASLGLNVGIYWMKEG